MRKCIYFCVVCIFIYYFLILALNIRKLDEESNTMSIAHKILRGSSTKMDKKSGKNKIENCITGHQELT